VIDPYVVLARPRIDISPDAEYLSGKRVLVTGAGGSIGSALCQRLTHLGLANLVMLDRDESALHATQLAIRGRALLDDDTTVLGDIRDSAWIRDVFTTVRPDVVFHTAALKHQPLLERYPAEAVKTNVLGTLNVLRAAARAGVRRFINVSTDKAADPTCVLGASKRVAERLVAWYRPERFVSVRFGNVFGSRGSAVETFVWQARERGLITVTDPGMVRYFITSDEAIDLLIHAGAIGRFSEVLVMDMGAPIHVAVLAQRIAYALGIPVEIVYTGSRPGEKFGEVVLATREVDRRPSHPMISQVLVPALACSSVGDILDHHDPEKIRKHLFDLLAGEVL